MGKKEDRHAKLDITEEKRQKACQARKDLLAKVYDIKADMKNQKDERKYQWITPEIITHLDTIDELITRVIIEESNDKIIETYTDVSTNTLKLLNETAPSKQAIEEYQLLAMRVQGKPSITLQYLGIAMMALSVTLMAITLSIMSGGLLAPVAIAGTIAALGGLGIFASNQQKGDSKKLQHFVDDLNLSSDASSSKKTT